jgi:glyoxylase-like metal-dependent hydrolase (beta-lactamase superfamily II)
MDERTQTWRCIRVGKLVSNVWLLPDTPDGPVLVDAGFHSQWGTILQNMRKHGVTVRELRGVLLTHRHVDHAANAARLSAVHGIPVYAHGADAAFLRGDATPRPLPEPKGIVGMFARIENHFPARIPGVVPVQHGDVIAGLEALAMPGHTEGSVFWWHRASGTLFSGDTLLNAQPPLVYRVGLNLPYVAFCDDYDESLRSLERFAQWEGEVQRVCPGHGPERVGPVRERLTKLLKAHRLGVRRTRQRKVGE